MPCSLVEVDTSEERAAFIFRVETRAVRSYYDITRCHILALHMLCFQSVRASLVPRGLTSPTRWLCQRCLWRDQVPIIKVR
jgi:hypothetical protein